MTDSGHAQFGFFITWCHNQRFDNLLSNSGNEQFGLNFIVSDLTINALSCLFHTAHLAICKQFKGEGFFLSLIASMFLNSRESTNQGHDQFSDRSFFMSLSALIFNQLRPIHQWKCEEIDCVLRHGDDLFLDAIWSRQLPDKETCPLSKLPPWEIIYLSYYTGQFLAYVFSIPVMG